MSLSFQRVIEIMNENSELLEYAQSDNRIDEKRIGAIRAGLSLGNNSTEFWENFMRLCNHAEGLSFLLDVPKERIAKWPAAIREYLELVQKMDSNEQATTKKAKLITTGY